MALLPASIPFLSARGCRRADVVILGAPLDLTETFRNGTAHGPQGIRQVSDCLETYSPIQGRDLEDIVLADWGDIDLHDQLLPDALALIERETLEAAASALPIILGGEHTLTLGCVRGLRARYQGLAVLHIDAHLDLIEEYEGLKVSHATVMRRIAESIGWENLVQVGVRSGTRAEWKAAEQCLYSSSDLALPPFVQNTLGDKPVFLSLDIDVLDPAFAPGTGCPEPGGPDFRDLLNFIYTLRSLNVVGIDIVEVLPTRDPAEITAVAAAKLVRELALLFGTSRNRNR